MQRSASGLQGHGSASLKATNGFVLAKLREGGKINNLSDLASIVDADCYVCGHIHLPASFKKCYYRTDTQNSSVQKVTKLFVSTASALEYGGYGDVQGYAPSANDYPYITFSGSRKFMRASV